MKKDVGVTSKGENKVGTIPISTAADTILCIAQAIIAADIYRDCYIPTVFSSRCAAHSDGVLIPLTPTLFLPFLLVIPLM